MKCASTTEARRSEPKLAPTEFGSFAQIKGKQQRLSRNPRIAPRRLRYSPARLNIRELGSANSRRPSSSVSVTAFGNARVARTEIQVHQETKLCSWLHIGPSAAIAGLLAQPQARSLANPTLLREKAPPEHSDVIPDRAPHCRAPAVGPAVASLPLLAHSPVLTETRFRRNGIGHRFTRELLDFIAGKDFRNCGP